MAVLHIVDSSAGGNDLAVNSQYFLNIIPPSTCDASRILRGESKVCFVHLPFAQLLGAKAHSGSHGFHFLLLYARTQGTHVPVKQPHYTFMTRRGEAVSE